MSEPSPFRTKATSEQLFSDFESALAAIGERDPMEAFRQDAASDRQANIYAPIRWALRSALFEDDPAALDRLISRGLGLEWPVAFWSGTPLHEAALVGAPHCARHLLSLGANPNAKNKEGFPALQIACEQRNLPILRLLRRNGAVLPDDPRWDGSEWDPIRSILRGIDHDFQGYGAEDFSPLIPGSAPSLLWSRVCGFGFCDLLPTPQKTGPSQLSATLHEALHFDPEFNPVLLWMRSREERRSLRSSALKASLKKPSRPGI